jgi:hypothetical protein
MTHVLVDLSRALTASPFGLVARSLLRNVRGFAPIIQTVHILSVAAVMGSVVLVDLKVLGLALPSQPTSELTRRLMPWTWWALLSLASSGLVSVFARPERYLLNPVFGLKFAMLTPAIILAVLLQRASAKDVHFWEQSRGRRASAKTIAAFSLLLWLGVAMAGRWIAYADYLFPQ